MKGYQNPNNVTTLGLGACFITPFKTAMSVYYCTYGAFAVL